MATRFTAELNPKDVDSVLSMVEDLRKESPKLIFWSLKKGANKGQSETVNNVYAKANLTKTKIKKRTSVRFYSISQLTAKLRIKSGNIPLEEFNGTKVYKSQSKPGVYFKIWRDEAQENYRHAFGLAANPQDITRGVWEREINALDYDGRYPLRRKFGPSVATVFEKTPRLSDHVLKTATDTMVAELNRLVNLKLDSY